MSSSSAEGASGFCQTMPPSGRQLMSIGASEHRPLVRAKARFAGQKAQEHSFVRRNAVFTGHIAMYRWRLFLAESAARALPFPMSQRPTCPFSFAPGGTPPTRPSATSAPSRCEPIPAFPLPPGPPTCPRGPLRLPPLLGVSRFRRISSHLRRVTQAPGPALWQRAHRNRQPPAMLLC